MCLSSDEADILVLAELPAGSNEKFVFIYSLLLLKHIACIITIRLHFRDVNTSLSGEEKQKEIICEINAKW
jgi:hypothetical protein